MSANIKGCPSTMPTGFAPTAGARRSGPFPNTNAFRIQPTTRRTSRQYASGRTSIRSRRRSRPGTPRWVDESGPDDLDG